MSWFGFGSAPAPAPAPKVSDAVVQRRRTSNGPTFTSTKCPPGAGLEQSCELPFGLIWTPMAALAPPKLTAKSDNGMDQESSLSSAIPVIDCPTPSLPPVLCLSCLSYVNPYCKVEGSTGVWTCFLCDTKNVLPKSLLTGRLAPAFSASMVEYHQPLPLPPNYDEDDSCSIIVVVDANLERTEVQGIMDAIEQVMPELVHDSTEHEDPLTPGRHPKIQLGLIVFDKEVAMYQLGIAGVASADVYAPLDGTEDDDTLIQRRLAMEQRAYLQPIIHEESDLESFSQCLSAVFGVSVDDDDKLKRAPRKDMLRKKKEARMREEELKQEKGTSSMAPDIPNESPWVQQRLATKSAHSQRRCTGEALQCAIDMASLGEVPSRTSRILLFTNGCPNVGDGSVVAEPTEHSATTTTATQSISLFGGKSKDAVSPTKKTKTTKHNVVDGGQMSKAIQYYDITGSFAIETGIAIDVFCCGAMELGLPAYQALVEPSGGYVLPHSTFFDSPHLAHNLTVLLKHSYVSRTTAEIHAGINEEVTNNKGFGRFFGRKPTATDADVPKHQAECFVDIRSDSYLIPTHLVGPGELVDAVASKASKLLPNERAAFAEGAKLAAAEDFPTHKMPNAEALNLSLTRIRMTRVDPLASLAVLVQVDDTIESEDEFACFQMIARHVDRDGKNMITRVSTHRLTVATSVSEYVQGVDDEVVSVLLAKSAVFRSLHGRDETEDTKDKVVAGDQDTLEKLAYEAQLDLDATIHRISGAFRLLGLEEKTKSLDLEAGGDARKEEAHSSLDFAFPPQLTEGLRRLYHLRRGALISPGPMRSMDDRAEVRQRFLRFPLEDCIGMMAPSLWSTEILEDPRSSVMTSFPAETMALWDASIIAADQHDVQFVWTGKCCTESSFDTVRNNFEKFLTQQGNNRFPMPEVRMLVDGDSMSRRFTTRLAPSHADSKNQQLANFPDLSKLPKESLESLRSRFKFYDAASDASFRKWFWSVSSATHASREDGLSLCE